jgi:hypothetical protein
MHLSKSVENGLRADSLSVSGNEYSHSPPIKFIVSRTFGGRSVMGGPDVCDERSGSGGLRILQRPAKLFMEPDTVRSVAEN